MGVGGIGVSGLALILKASGHQVSGCDQTLNELTRKLETHGVRVFHGHSADHITPDVDVLVAPTWARDTESEVVTAKAQGKRVIRRIELLGDLMREKRGIGVAGTHGKTSTSAMVATVFEGCGADPSAQIGGVVRALNGNAKVGRGKHFIAEIDESDPLFALIPCDIAIVTNIEDDHVSHDSSDHRPNYHRSVEALHEAFQTFAKSAGTVVYCADWTGLDAMLEGANLVSYGLHSPAKYRAESVDLIGGKPRFTLTRDGQALVDVTLVVPGEHNVLNAVAALAVADLEGLDLIKAAKALEDFPGAGRRWEVVGQLNGALLIDDYAHNPTKVSSAIAGAKTTGRRVRVVFQPHRVGRTAREWQNYADILRSADEVMILDIYTSSETPIEGIHATLIETRMHELGYQPARYWQDRAALSAYILETASASDVIVTMGAGDVTRILRELPGVKA
ncbi:MAG: UDP-N-acetylmuramate--L-alanine ligase [Pleurocapsa sp. SU_196_0]|nr:UDP-N-acetylmuramate--L-alanine ligase [Pleurocapsa sp. SU_196_0]